MLSLLNLKFKDKKKKKTLRKMKGVTKYKKVHGLKKRKIKFSKKKKLLLKKFFVGNNSLKQQSNLTLSLIQLRELNLDSLNNKNTFEVNKAVFSLVKLSQILKMGSKLENSLEVSPFFFQESFLVSSSVEKMKRENSLRLGNKSFLLPTAFKKSIKKEKIFKRKKKKITVSKKKVIVLKKTFVKGNKKSLSTGVLVKKKTKQLLKAKKTSIKVSGNLVAIARKRTKPLLKVKQTFVNVLRELAVLGRNLPSFRIKREEKPLALKADVVFSEVLVPKKRAKESFGLKKKSSSFKGKKEAKKASFSPKKVSGKTVPEKKTKKPSSARENLSKTPVSSKK